MVISSSPLLSKVYIPSFSKYTSVPCSFSFRTAVRLSTVFRAKRLTDLVTIRSMRPASASSIIRLKPSRPRVLTAEIPSSVYTSTNSQSGLERMYLV